VQGPEFNPQYCQKKKKKKTNNKIKRFNTVIISVLPKLIYISNIDPIKVIMGSEEDRQWDNEIY
jgi:hypothetical protein